jgi:mono/diheme cytochrome c family protein
MNTQTIRIARGAITLASLLAFGFSAVSAAKPDTAAGAALYKTKCAACHGADGTGATAVGKADSIRDLGSADVQAQSDAALTTIIASGKGKMPAYGKNLKPEQIQSMVAYIRSLKK